MCTKQYVLRGILRDQGGAKVGKQDRNRMCLQQCFCGDVSAESKQLLAPHSRGRKIDMLDDMVQSDMREEARGSSESGRKEPRKCGNRVLRGCKAGEDEVVP